MVPFQRPFYGLGTTDRPLKKLVESGILGWPLKVTVSGITGFDWKFYWTGRHNLKPEPVPGELDYDFWLGPAPYKPYNPERVHSKFRGFRSDIKDLEKLINSLPDPEPQVTRFTESILTRKKFALNEANGHRSCSVVNLGVIALRLGRNLRYNSVLQ